MRLDLPEHGLEDGLEPEALLGEFEKELDIDISQGVEVDQEPSFSADEPPSEVRRKSQEFLHRHDRLVLPACADCQHECKLMAPAGAEITLICRDWVPLGGTT